MTYTETRKFVNIDKITRKWNVRISENGDDLIASISQSGILTPLMVNGDDNGSYPTIRGHRRSHGLRTFKAAGTDGLSEEQIVIWNRLFNEGSEGYEGIPVTVITGASERELTELHIDQDTKPLRYITELAMVAKALFLAGMKQFCVAEHMAGMLDTILPPRGKKAADIADLKADPTKHHEYREAYGLFRRGTVQYLKVLTDLPQQVLWALEYQETNVLNSDCVAAKVTAEELPKITRKVCADLEKAFKLDNAIELKGKNPYNRTDTGPNFDAEWRKQVDATNEAKTTSETRQKAMSSKDITDSRSQYRSDGLAAMCKTHAGIDTEVDILQADALLWVAEKVAEGNPVMWKTVVAEATKLHKDSQAAVDAAVKEQIKKTTTADAAKVKSKAKAKA